MDRPNERDPQPRRCGDTLEARPDGLRLLALRDGDTLHVRDAAGVERARWRVGSAGERPRLSGLHPAADEAALPALLAALELLFAHDPACPAIVLDPPPPHAEALARAGLVLRDAAGAWQVPAACFWQQPRTWLTPPLHGAFPLQYVLSHGRRHPCRPPKPAGTVYARHIPWLGRTLTFRGIDPERDLARFHRWMNDPVVEHFWQEAGGIDHHRAYLHGIAADPHAHGLVACLDDDAFGYFEVYWAKEDRIAPFYDADDFDRGWHVLIGEAAFRGRPFVTAWLPSISHYLFLDDCRTRRIVIEPRVDNARMLRSLDRCGYALLKEFDFPHKRAVLGMLLRERFFADRLWGPRDPVAAPSTQSPSDERRHAHP